MPETTFLHIQARDSSPTRVLELADASVRIGRGAQCEVRLGEPALAEVQCMLRRRGETWHVQPIGPPGRIAIEGRPIEQQRPLPLGVPLQVGEHWLTLRPDDLASPSDWGTATEPIPPDPPSSPEPGPSHARTGSPDAERERLERWQARLEQRERWLQNRQEERRWEARWKAAGEGLRARATSKPPEPTPPPRPTIPGPVPINRVEPSIRPRPVATLQDVPISPRPPSIRDVLRRQAVEPRKPEAAPFVAPAEPPRVKPIEDRVPAEIPLFQENGTASPESPQETPLRNGRESALTEPAPILVDRPADPIPTELARGVVILASTVQCGVDPPPTARPGPERSRRVADRKPATSPTTPAVSPPPPNPTADPQWPSARAILAAHCARPEGRTEPAPASKSAVRRPVPTVALEPGHWTIPGWRWLWFPAFAVVVGVGLASLKVAWAWAEDARAAGLVANRLLRADPPLSDDDDEAIAAVVMPDATWWRSTAGNLLLRALAADRASDDPRREDDVRALLETARTASPAQASVRFALARAGPGESADVPLIRSLGLSRDVVSLAWSGHQLVKAGKPEVALNLYRAAMEMAARTDLDRLAPPTFQDDKQVNRYTMPSEDLIGAVIRDMAGQPGWSFEQWSAALPTFAVAPLVAARVLREKESPDADHALDLALQVAEGPCPPGSSAAVHLAARGEVLALKGRWEEAESAYRQAIDQMPDPTVRRSWWMNLADIYLRLGDETRKRAAWEAAKGPDPDEEITRRAINEQVQAGIGPGTASSETREKPERLNP